MPTETRPLSRAKVADSMGIGVLSCPPDTALREVARLMATYRIHSVIVADMLENRPLGLISAIDVATAASTPDAPAGEFARGAVVTVNPDDSLDHATRLMAEHDVTHLVVVHRHTGDPVGILTALDVAGALAWGD